MKEADIKAAIEYLQQYPYLNTVDRLCEAILNGENTENKESVLVFARRIRKLDTIFF